MNEPQVWTLIGVFATALFGVIGLMTAMLMRIVKAGFDRVDAQFARVDAQFEAVHVKFDHLDRDIQAIARRVFPEHE